MDSNSQDSFEKKAEDFALRLWDNPSLLGLSPLQKEEQLHAFIEANVATLQPALTSAAYFKDLPWPSVMELLRQAIFKLASQDLGFLYESILKDRVDISFFRELVPSAGELPFLKEQLGQYVKKFANKSISRKELTGPLMGAATDMVDKYMAIALKRQKYIGIELRKVQRLKFNEKQIASFVKLTMLLRPSVYYYSPTEGTINISPGYAQMVTQATLKELKFIPRALIQSGINSFLSFQNYPHIESTARLAAIFSLRCRDMKSGLKVGRGAESSDKSWFSIARKNYKYHGFDMDMLYELYSIATENGW